MTSHADYVPTAFPIASRPREQMDRLLPALLQARKHLEEFQKHRARCLASCAGVRERKARVVMGNFLALNLAAFRLRADDIACTLADVYGDAICTGRVKGIDPPVDLFFGEIMRLDADPSSPGDLSVHMGRLHRAGRQFTATVRKLLHEGTSGSRLDDCEREFERRWRAVLRHRFP